MRVAREIAGAGNYMRGYARTLEDALGFFSIARAGPFTECAIDLVATAQPPDEQIELRVEKRAGDDLPQCSPVLIARRINYDPSIITCGLVHTMRTPERRAGITATRRDRPISRVFVVSGREELNSSFR